jgi:hypothetical protein
MLWDKDAFGGEIIDGEALEEERKQEHLMAIIRSRSQSFGPSGDEEPSDDDENLATRRAIDELFQRVEKSEPIPMGLAKFVLKRARNLKTTLFAERLLINLDHFLPVVGDVVDYVLAVDRKNKKGLLKGVFEWLLKGSVLSKTAFVQEWTGHLVCVAPDLLPTWDSVETVFSELPQSIVARYRPLAAARKGNWGFVRQQKEHIDAYDDAAQRAIVLASSVLAYDEKRHWLSRFENSSDVILRACVAHSKNNPTI